MKKVTTLVLGPKRLCFNIQLSSKLYFLNRDIENDKAIEDVLHSKGNHQSELINELLADEKYQREAFKAMFLQQDSRNKEITAQVEQIQNELASLSMVEMTKTNLKVFILIYLLSLHIYFFSGSTIT